jgi:hypothetical protein
MSLFAKWVLIAFKSCLKIVKQHFGTFRFGDFFSYVVKKKCVTMSMNKTEIIAKVTYHKTDIKEKGTSFRRLLIIAVLSNICQKTDIEEKGTFVLTTSQIKIFTN